MRARRVFSSDHFVGWTLAAPALILIATFGLH